MRHAPSGRLRTLALGVAALHALGCGDGAASADAPPPRLLAVEATRVRLEAGYEVREYFAGRVAAKRASELGFERSGTVVEVLVEEGDRVEAGQSLARLESRQLRAERRELAARVREIQSRLELARRTTTRRERLREEESISEQAFDEARFAEQALVNQLAAARAGIDRVDVALELSALVAPYAGVVAERRVDEGTVVAPGQTLLRLIETQALEFRVGLPRETLGGIEPDTSYRVEIGDDVQPVHLRAVLPTVEPQTRTVMTVFGFEGRPVSAQDGTVGKLVLETRRQGPGFWLPITALAESHRGLWSAYALAADPSGEDVAVVERRELQVIHPESNRVFVRGTLREGERVVATGLHRIVPGQRVRVLPAGS